MVENGMASPITGDVVQVAAIVGGILPELAHRELAHELLRHCHPQDLADDVVLFVPPGRFPGRRLEGTLEHYCSDPQLIMQPDRKHRKPFDFRSSK